MRLVTTPEGRGENSGLIGRHVHDVVAELEELVGRPVALTLGRVDARGWAALTRRLARRRATSREERVDGWPSSRARRHDDVAIHA